MCGYVSNDTTRRNDNSDDVLWFWGQKVSFDHNILWFESKNRAKKRTKNIDFSPPKKGKNIDDIVKI